MTSLFRRLLSSATNVLTPSKPEPLPKLDTNPLLPVISRALTVIETLEQKSEFMRDQLERRRQDLIHAEIADYREAIGLNGGGWLVRESSTGKLGTTIKESDSPAVIQCKETIADLQMALEDRGWWRELNQSQWEFSRWGIQRIILLSRLYRIKNPLIQRGILVSAYYVFGRGFEISSKDETADAVIQAFLNDPRNKDEIGQRALIDKEAAKYTDGNIFWAFFEDPSDGATIIRTIDALEIEEIISDPNDASIPRYYHRRWTEQVFDERSAVTNPTPRDEWYVAMGYEPPKSTTIQNKPLMKDAAGNLIPIYHVKSGGLMKWKFGCPRVYAALDWARAYKRRMENYATITEALARFSWSVETEGGAPAIAAFKQTLATTLGNTDGLSLEQNPPPVTGAAWISSPSNKLTPIKTAGIAPDPEEGRRLALMVYCVFGLPETFFGDVSVGTLATAQSLDRPTELKFLKEQEDWREDLQRICYFVLDRSRTAPKGRMREAKSSAEDITVEVKFPSIIQGDTQEQVKAIVSSMTLDGYSCIGIDQRTGIGMLLTELGVEDVEEVLEAMFPDYDPDRSELMKAELDAKVNPPEPKPMVKAKASEADLARAIGELRRAALKLQENGHVHN